MPNKKPIRVGQLVKIKEGLKDGELGDYANKLGLVLCHHCSTVEPGDVAGNDDEGLWDILIAGRQFIFNEEWLVPWREPRDT